MGLNNTARLQGWGITVVRVVTGIIFLFNGLQKLSLQETVARLNELGSLYPSALAFIVLLVELIGGLALVVGLFTRLVSIPLALGMLLDILLVHPPSSVFATDAYFESACLRLGVSVALILAGSGKAAVDGFLAPREEDQRFRTRDIN